ncbi:transmembrane protein 256 isoform X2 [Herpailurus yagouaroundi]|uniref:transmembrane protein 256 isoform X2 n=1 Tax=Herpailurus yagouaroundi TaxID=1608482 RepID=UPI001AD7182D|nr:transmembrane protein 256 isoform X2 [Puma yagouaroundi]
MIRRRSSRSSPARHRAAASPAPCGESGAHPSLVPACPPALQSVGGLETGEGGGSGQTDGWTERAGAGWRHRPHRVSHPPGSRGCPASAPRPSLLRSSDPDWFLFLRPPRGFATQQSFYKGASTRAPSSRMPTGRSSSTRPTNTTSSTAWLC